MKYLLTYNTKNSAPEDLCLEPEYFENENELYKYSTILNVKNPASDFNELVMQGKMNEMSDDDYAIAARRMKFISEKIFRNLPSSNIFMLNELLTKYALGTIHLDASDVKGKMGVTVAEFIEAYGISCEERSALYGFIADCVMPENVSLFDEKYYHQVELEGRLKFTIPRKPCTHYIEKENVILVLTAYDPSYTCLTSSTTMSFEEFCDFELFPDDFPFEPGDNEHTSEEMEKLAKTAMIQSGKTDLTGNKDIELYIYEPGTDIFTYHGNMKYVCKEELEDGNSLLRMEII